MAKKNLWIGFLVMVLVFGMMVIGCNNSVDVTGIWVDIEGREHRFINGNFENSFLKGTYNIERGKIEFKVTHVTGHKIGELYSQMDRNCPAHAELAVLWMS